jgi:hypothetical protein
MHSSWGMESANFVYKKIDGALTTVVRITGLAFQPVQPEEAIFK